MGKAGGERRRESLLQELVAWWPSLPFMAFGLWSAWAALAYSGSLWLSDNEVDGTYISQMYVISTFACAAVFLLAPLAARFGKSRLMAGNRAVLVGGASAAAACLGIILAGPYYLGPALASLGNLNRALFCVCAAVSGLGTGVVGLRCGVMYGHLTPKHALAYAALSQLVCAFVYLLTFACPRWALVAHGPAFTDVAFFCVLPMAAAVLACLGPGSDGDTPCREREAGEPVRLPATFWRFAAFVFFLSLLASFMRSAVVTTHAPAATLAGSDVMNLLRVVMGVVFVLYAIRAERDRGMALGRTCTLLAAATAVVMAAVAAFGGLTNGWSVVIYFGASVLEMVMWCLLAFIVVQRKTSALVVFGWGRGYFILGAGAGWLLGGAVDPATLGGTSATVALVAASALALLAGILLFSERDYERLFATQGEQEPSLEDMFSMERKEREEQARRRAEKRGKFSRAIEELKGEYGLSSRESEVLRCLAMGYGADRIADTMGVKVNTARAHTHNVYVKLNVHSREELMRLVDARVAALPGESTRA